jgi:hypothetical protein
VSFGCEDQQSEAKRKEHHGKQNSLSPSLSRVFDPQDEQGGPQQREQQASQDRDRSQCALHTDMVRRRPSAVGMVLLLLALVVTATPISPILWARMKRREEK